MKIAIIGAGISGLTAAYLLHRHHEVVVYESSDVCGGHTATVDIELDGISHSVDTGFIVFNDWTYPNFIKLMDQLGIPGKPTEMGFSVTTRRYNGEHSETGTTSSACSGSGAQPSLDAGIEYCGSSLKGLFADRQQLFNPAFLGMLKDIVRFNRRATRDLEQDNIDTDISIAEYLDGNNYGPYFRDFYLIPMASAIWSAPTSKVGDFNALFFLQFYQNHGLLSLGQRPQWRVIDGGSRNYIGPMIHGFANNIRMSNRARVVRRATDRITVSCNRDVTAYDQVIFACHSDQALALLDNPSAGEQAILGAIPYRDNSVVLHTDSSVLPRRRRAWTSWNYLLDGSETKQPVLTYHMNTLQGINAAQDICVSVNGDQHIDPAKVIRKFSYSHPQFGPGSVEAQLARNWINGVNRSWFCGAYWGNGFHEDGVVSALSVAAALGGDSLS